MVNKKKEYLLSLIAQGEHEQQDFKYQISDARKIARSISAFANNRGGRLLIGVRDNGNIAGVNGDEEIYMIQQAADMYCRPPQKPLYEAYVIEGKTVVIATINEAEQKPVKAPDEHGKYKTFYRVADENVLATAAHARVLRDASYSSSNPVLSFTDNERALLAYLRDHGGITINGYARLTHTSRFTAEDSVVKLCEMGVLEIQYHNGACLLTLRESDE